MLSPELNWQLAMWTELLASLLLVIGLGTRLSACALLCVDLVAWYSVHAGHGYNVVDNGYQLPLMYAVMLVAVVLSGPGRLSVDSVLVRRFRPA
jgi:putative oxidoreductase